MGRPKAISSYTDRSQWPFVIISSVRRKSVVASCDGACADNVWLVWLSSGGSRPNKSPSYPSSLLVCSQRKGTLIIYDLYIFIRLGKLRKKLLFVMHTAICAWRAIPLRVCSMPYIATALVHSRNYLQSGLCEEQSISKKGHLILAMSFMGSQIFHINYCFPVCIPFFCLVFVKPQLRSKYSYHS